METSNLFSNCFKVNQAKLLAARSLDEGKKAQLEALSRHLETENSISFTDHLKQHIKTKKQTSARKNATSAFMGILTFGQMGLCDLIQDKADEEHSKEIVIVKIQ